MVYLSLLLIGAILGLVSSFFGVGGGIIAIPALFFLFPKLSPETVIGCSFGMIFLSSTINSFNFYRSGMVPSARFLIPLALTFIIGVILGTHLMALIPPVYFKKFFGILLFCIATKNFIGLKIQQEKKKKSLEVKSPSSLPYNPFIQSHWVIRTIVVGIISGTISGLTGLGGGIVMIPLFVEILSIPFKLLSFYSNWVMLFGSFTGLVGQLLKQTEDVSGLLPDILAKMQFGQVNMGIMLFILIGGLFTSKLGIFLNKKSSEVPSKILFSLLLLVMGLKILLNF